MTFAEFEAAMLVFGDFVVLSFVVPLSIFIVRYAFWSPWRSTELGRHLMYQKASIAAVIALILLALFIPDFFLRAEVRLIAYLAVGFFLWLDVVTLIRIQREFPMTRTRRKRR
jgi:hypothetical protein